MYITIKDSASSELIEKKSKFIANVFHVETQIEAEDKIKEMKKMYYNAKHNCSAYIVLKDGITVEKASDDGEPAGTAGGPILNILKKNNLYNVLVVVTRYFGGILLGTGGLVRAYSSVTNNAIEKADKLEFHSGKQYEVTLNYNNLQNLKYYCKKNKINIAKIKYLDEVVCILEISDDFVEFFLQDIEERKVNILKYKKICDKFI